MDFSLTVALVTSAFVIFEGLLSWREGTLTRSGRANPQLPFLWHGGMWADALILPVINALLWPNLVWHLGNASLSLVTGIVTAMIAHWWWSRDLVRDPFWPAGRSRPWWKALKIVGWLHLGFFIAQIGSLTLAVQSHVSNEVVGRVSALFVVFILLAVVQPQLILRRKPY